MKSRDRFDVILGPQETTVYPRKRKKKIYNGSAWYYLGLVGQIGFVVAVPIAGGALLGAAIDNRWSLYPKATLTCLIIGIIVSSVHFVRTVAEITKKRTH